MLNTSYNRCNGTTWCGFKDTLDNVIGGAAIYNDNIYISGGFWKANSDSIPYIAKLKYPNLFNTCVNVDVQEFANLETIKIYPNPTISTLFIVTQQNELQHSTITVTNN